MNKLSYTGAFARNLTLLAALTVILLYATTHWGGVGREDRSVYLLALGLLALCAALVRAGTKGMIRLDPIFRWLLPLLPAYVALQIIPLPAGLVATLSPARGQVLASLGAVGANAPYASLSVFPPGTLQHLLLISGYLAVFLLVRELMWFFSDRQWILSVPLVGIGTWQAVLGLVQYLGAGDKFARGNYVNRNHFAGLLELTISFAVAYPLAFFRGRSHRHSISTSDAVRISVSWAIAVVMLTGIVFSLSRMGFISALFALFVIGALTVLTSKPARRVITPARKWAAVGGIAVVVLTLFVFLPPDVFVQRFAAASSNEGIDEGRVQLWKETLGLIRAYPIFGCGLGGYGSAFPKYKVSGPLLTDDQAHDDYLQLLAEMGIVGAAILAVLAGATVRAAFRGAFIASNPSSWSLSIACAGSLGAILLHSTADFNLYIPANAMVVAWVAAIASSVSRQSPLGQTLPSNKVAQVV